jgi:excisionase family DNA binding protein
MTTVEKAFCTTSEAAALLGVSVGTVQMWVESGLLDAWKTSGGHRRVVRESILRLLHKAPGTNANQVDVSAPAARAAPLSILVVEDDANLLRLYQANISNWPGDIRLLTFESAFAALIQIGRSMPDLLILDLHLPGIDGFSMLRVLRDAPETAQARIVVVSGMDEAARAERGGLPMDVEVLPKPIPFARLQAIAGEIIQSRRFQPPSSR